MGKSYTENFLYVVQEQVGLVVMLKADAANYNSMAQV